MYKKCSTTRLDVVSFTHASTKDKTGNSLLLLLLRCSLALYYYLTATSTASSFSTFFCLLRPCLILLMRRAVQKGIRKCKQINSLAYYASLPPLSLTSCSPLYLVFPLSLARWRGLLACFFPRRRGRLGHFCWDMLYDYVSKRLTYVFSIGPRGACGLIWVLSLNLKTVLIWTRSGCLSAKMHKMWMRSRAGLWAISKMNGRCFV